MRKESHDRARAEYIKSHSRERRVRLAFREAVQALSYTPPTLSKKETVADATHSS